MPRCCLDEHSHAQMVPTQAACWPAANTDKADAASNNFWTSHITVSQKLTVAECWFLAAPPAMYSTQVGNHKTSR